MHFTTASFVFATLISTAYAHMEMSEPAPFRGKTNQFAKDAGLIDFSNTNPLNPSGADFPCKGYHEDLNGPAGGATATYAAGSQQTLKIVGGAAHNGGSCQVSLSFDNGASFKVIKSIIGNCPNPNGDSSFPFTIPQDAASGKAILAWTWNNNTGNRELYMNCAAVEITGSGTSKLENKPDVFVANTALNTCAVPSNVDVIYPNPGDDVTDNKTASAGPPTGDCGSAPVANPPPADSDPTTTAVGAPSTSAPSSAPVVSGGITSSTSAGAPVVTPVPGGPTTGAITVANGDTCSDLAATHGVTVEQIFANNPAINAGCTNLVVGQSLILRKRSRIMRDLA